MAVTFLVFCALLYLLRLSVAEGYIGKLPTEVQRWKRQVQRTPPAEAINEREGILDPALLSMMLSASGIMPSVGSSTMSNAFSTFCTYPYLVYYYQYCMGMGSTSPNSVGAMYPYGANSAPSYASASGSYPMYSSSATGGIESNPGSFGPSSASPYGSSYGPSSFNNPSYNGQFMNPYAWASSASEPPGSPSGAPYAGPENPPSPLPNAGPGPGAGPGSGLMNVPGPSPNSGPMGGPMNGLIGGGNNNGGNPGSSPSTSLGMPQIQNPAFPRTNLPRGSPMLLDAPVSGLITPADRMKIRSQFPILDMGGFAPMYGNMFGPLVDGRPEALTVSPHNRTTSPNNKDNSSSLTSKSAATALSTTVSPIAQFMDPFLPSLLADRLSLLFFTPKSQDPISFSDTYVRRHAVEKKKLQKVLTKMTAKGLPPPVPPIFLEFEKYLSVAFELVAAGNKSTVTNSTLIAPRNSGGPELAKLQPMYRPSSTVILMAFANSTTTHTHSCVSTYFCRATKQLMKNGLPSGVEVLQIVSPFAGQLLEQSVSNAYYAITKGIEVGKLARLDCDQFKCF